MTKRIYKYQLPIQEIVTLSLPKGAEVIRIDGLEGKLWLWAIVDTKAPKENRTFYLYKTGGDMIDKQLKYLGCGAIFIQMELMLYVFEEHENVTPFSLWGTTRIDCGGSIELQGDAPVSMLADQTEG